MIIDSHAHIFEKWSGACGLPSRDLHWRYIQKNVTRPAAKVFRFRDGVPADASPLFRAGDNTWAGLRDDVRFRVGPYGRLEFTVDGEDYYVQYMPVGMAEIESTPEFLITQMNAAGVEHCVLQAGFTYGAMNDYNALAQKQFPERFTGLFHVDEARADEEGWMAEARRAVERLGLRGLYYSLEQFSRYGFDVWFDDRRFNAFWEMLQGFGLPVFIEFSSIPGYDQAGYMNVIGALRRPHGSVSVDPLVVGDGAAGAILRPRRPLGLPGGDGGRLRTGQRAPRNVLSHHLGRCMGLSLPRGPSVDSRSA